MRVTSGLLKNRVLESPASADIRPTSGKVRAAFFSTIGDKIRGSRFLDLFAGTGAVGIEAYSRGAAYVTFMDIKTDILKKNLKLLPQRAYSIVSGDIWKKRIGGCYDIIYIDPPYGKYSAGEILEWVRSRALLAPDGVIVYEESSRNIFDCSGTVFSIIKERKYGDTKLLYMIAAV